MIALFSGVLEASQLARSCRIVSYLFPKMALSIVVYVAITHLITDILEAFHTSVFGSLFGMLTCYDRELVVLKSEEVLTRVEKIFGIAGLALLFEESIAAS